MVGSKRNLLSWAAVHSGAGGQGKDIAQRRARRFKALQFLSFVSFLSPILPPAMSEPSDICAGCSCPIIPVPGSFHAHVTDGPIYWPRHHFFCHECASAGRCSCSGCAKQTAEDRLDELATFLLITRPIFETNNAITTYMALNYDTSLFSPGARPGVH